ncbi:MAG: undecaprenyl/decaprenyl-phosphate alpha-N-acetylglucosaminyl 1-phosphate transferase [Verrucomicrobia bacterium]|nr:undecaprenyl/decaprenyl-phosphate alpha-N-acetylglucosaminyl 1-phosphate transferase [Verrucomicrobiota bacterium]
MSFPFNAYGLAFGSAFLTAWLSLPLWRAWCRRVGLVDHPGDRKIHRSATPLAGGLALATALVVPVLAGVLALELRWLGSATVQPLAYGLGQRWVQLAGLLVGALGMLALGLLDDRYELRASAKFAGQVLVALVVAACGVRITLFIPSLLASFLLTMLWILVVTNAVNLMDNMNGLCGGLGAIGAFWFGLKAAAAGQYLVALLAFLVTGALCGFLPHNFPQASVFLGDSGSHLVGYTLAVLAILPHFYSAQNPTALAVLNPLLILAVPLVDMAWVVLLRWRLRKPFWVGDTNHLSHRLVRAGASPTQAVLWIWLLAALAGAASFL